MTSYVKHSRKARFTINHKIKGVNVKTRTAVLQWAVKQHTCDWCGFIITVGTQYWSSSPLHICRRHVPERTWFD